MTVAFVVVVVVVVLTTTVIMNGIGRSRFLVLIVARSDLGRVEKPRPDDQCERERAQGDAKNHEPFFSPGYCYHGFASRSPLRQATVLTGEFTNKTSTPP